MGLFRKLALATAFVLTATPANTLTLNETHSANTDAHHDQAHNDTHYSAATGDSADILKLEDAGTNCTAGQIIESDGAGNMTCAEDAGDTALSYITGVAESGLSAETTVAACIDRDAGTGSRAAASAVPVGCLFFDSTNDILYRNNGSSWDESTAGIGDTHQTADSATTSVSAVTEHLHTTSGTAAAGLGVRVSYQMEESSGSNEDAAHLEVDWESAANTAETADFKILLRDIGTMEQILLLEGDTKNAIFGQSDTDGTNAAENRISMHHQSTGTIATGFGVTLRAVLEDSADNDDEAFTMDVIWDDKTSGSEDATATFNVMVGGSLTEVFRADGSAGYVGIGSNAPSSPLHVSKSVNDVYAARLVQLSTTSGRSFGALVTGGTNSSDIALLVENAAGTDLVEIGGDGKVGIGTSAPGDLLEVQAVAGSPGVINIATGELTVVDSNVLGRIDFYAPLESSGTDAILPGASIWAEADDTFTTTVNNTEIVFATATSATAAEVMRIDATGKLGINTAIPSTLLEVQADAGSAGTATLSSGELTVVDGDVLGRINFQAPLESDGTDAIAIAAAIYAEADATFSASVNNTEIVFATGESEAATEKMRLDSSGKLGINTALPGDLLEVQGDAGAAGIMNLATAELTVVDGNIIGQIDFYAPLESDGTDAILPGASIWAEADATFSASVNNTEIVFATATSAAAAEVIRIDSGGKLGINTAIPSTLLEVQADAGAVGTVTLSTAELTVVDGNQLGCVEFSSPLESDGTDAVLVAAAVCAEADDTFSASVNTTDLVFKMGTSEAAAEKVRFTQPGLVQATVGFDVIGAADMDYGSADVTDHTFTTDGTGTAEVALPAGSIDSTELLDGTILNADVNTSAAIAVSKTALTAGTNISLSTNTLNVDDAFLKNNANDTTTGNLGVGGNLTIDGDMYASAGSTVGSLGAAGDGTFHIHTASAGSVTADGGADDLVVENSTEVGITLLSPHDETSSIFFGSIDGTDDSARDARIHWRFSDLVLTVGTNTTGGLLNFKTDGGTVQLILDNTGLATFSQDVSIGDLAAVGSDPLCWDGSGASLIGDCSSLRQWKNNIVDTDMGLAEVLQLRAREFDWDEQHGHNRHDFGFVAEEVEAVNSLLVTYRPELTGVKYSRLTALLVKAMQELEARVAALEE